MVSHSGNTYVQKCRCSETVEVGDDLMKIQGIKEGLSIYRLKNNNNGPQDDAEVYIFHKTDENEDEKTNEDLEIAIDKNDIPCPRCRKRFEIIQKIAEKHPNFKKTDVIGICEFCRFQLTKEQPVCTCYKNVEKATVEEIEDVFRRYRLGLKMTTRQQMLKDLLVDTSKQDKTEKRTHLDFYFDEMSRKSKSMREVDIDHLIRMPGILPTWQHRTKLSDMSLAGQLRELRRTSKPRSRSESQASGPTGKLEKDKHKAPSEYSSISDSKSMRERSRAISAPEMKYKKSFGKEDEYIDQGFGKRLLKSKDYAEEQIRSIDKQKGDHVGASSKISQEHSLREGKIRGRGEFKDGTETTVRKGKESSKIKLGTIDEKRVSKTKDGATVKGEKEGLTTSGKESTKVKGTKVTDHDKKTVDREGKTTADGKTKGPVDKEKTKVTTGAGKDKVGKDVKRHSKGATTDDIEGGKVMYATTSSQKKSQERKRSQDIKEHDIKDKGVKGQDAKDKGAKRTDGKEQDTKAKAARGQDKEKGVKGSDGKGQDRDIKAQGAKDKSPESKTAKEALREVDKTGGKKEKGDNFKDMKKVNELDNEDAILKGVQQKKSDSAKKSQEDKSNKLPDSQPISKGPQLQEKGKTSATEKTTAGKPEPKAMQRTASMKFPTAVLSNAKSVDDLIFKLARPQRADNGGQRAPPPEAIPLHEGQKVGNQLPSDEEVVEEEEYVSTSSHLQYPKTDVTPNKEFILGVKVVKVKNKSYDEDRKSEKKKKPTLEKPHDYDQNQTDQIPDKTRETRTPTTMKNKSVKDNMDDLLLRLVQLKKSDTSYEKLQPQKKISEIEKAVSKEHEKTKPTPSVHKDLENKYDYPRSPPLPIISILDLETIASSKYQLKEKESQVLDQIFGQEIRTLDHEHTHGKKKRPVDVQPILFRATYKDGDFPLPKIDEIEQGQVPDKVYATTESQKGVMRYALSDRTFIDKGWTMLPTEKVVRKMNVYRMRPAHPEFDWFDRNKNKKEMFYDSGAKLADIDDNGRGRWYYKNGRVALDYYDTEDTSAHQRIVIYSNGEPDERGRSHPITILATFDYLGNGIVLDHSGKIRLKYNQSEGVVLDRTLGPVSHWKWHTLNDPPVLQQVMIDTQLAVKDANILNLGMPNEETARIDNEEMLAIEFDNFIKEKGKKLSQKFKPFQIKMKALKINENISLRVLDQANIYLLFRDGSTRLKLNIGMILDHKEIIDTDTAELGEVSNSLERWPARTESLAAMQHTVAAAQRSERAWVERDRRLRQPQPSASADRLIAPLARPVRVAFTAPYTPAASCAAPPPSLPTEYAEPSDPSDSTTVVCIIGSPPTDSSFVSQNYECKSRNSASNIYYNTRI